MIQKSYDKSEFGKLYLVPTPIGNLEDITLRALNVLKNVDIVFAEDTRQAYNLLKYYNINKKCESCHKYSEKKHSNKIIDILKKGNNIAYVSDRGTPLISDPGKVIVTEAINNNIDVISLPGANALLPAINMSGLDNSKFLFYGFLNSKESIRTKELKNLLKIKETIIFYEAPHRVRKTLDNILFIFGNRRISISREISKIHEEVFRGTLEESICYSENIKGEIVLIVEGNKKIIDSIDYIEEVKKIVNKGEKLSSAIKEIANLYDISKNDLYEKCKEVLK